jgi:ApaG protein
MSRSETVTDGIRVRVQSFYVPERSAPQRNLYCFAYQIRISNEGSEPARLVSRHWVITDGLGNIEEVRGPGVVGETPRLEQGEAYQYTSACPLPTPLGSMRGEYQMVRDDGRRFEAEIALFALELPHTLN